MNEEPFWKEVRKDAFLLLLGAVIGVVPTQVSSCVAAHEGRKQLLLQRRLDVVRDVSGACTRRVELAKRAINLADVTKVTGILSSAAGQEKILAQYERLQADAEESRIVLQGNLDLANAVFGTSLGPLAQPELEPPKKLREEARSALAELRRALPGLIEQCRETSRLLNSKLLEQ